jgi:hypothetical protein
MDVNARKVLEMLSEGKLTVEEAQRLLERLQQLPAERPSDAARPNAQVPTQHKPAETPGAGQPRFLRITVDSSDGDKVDIRVPLALIRAGIRLGAIVPEDARKRMQERGLDLASLSAMDSEELVSALSDLTVNVDAGDGDKVQVFCE